MQYYKLFTNMNNKDDFLYKLQRIGLTGDEAQVYAELLKEPLTHMAVSQMTGMNRTKVYRVVQDLEHQGLVARRTDDRGAFLTACDPAALELSITTEEEKVMERRGALQQLLPTLHALQSSDTNLFVTRSYEGIEGLKRMCWHELKAERELFAFGSGSIEDIIPSHHWAEKHRSLNVEAGYHIYEIINTDSDQATFTSNEQFMGLYHHRVLPNEVLRLSNQTTIYNNTVAIYHWREDQKSGVEIINKGYADMMRQVFRHYWSIAKLPTRKAL